MKRMIGHYLSTMQFEISNNDLGNIISCLEFIGIHFLIINKMHLNSIGFK